MNFWSQLYFMVAPHSNFAFLRTILSDIPDVCYVSQQLIEKITINFLFDNFIALEYFIFRIK